MSAFLIDHEHLNLIITWAIDNGIEDISPQKWFQEFYLENVRSLEYRYPESHQELIYWGLEKHRYVPNGDAIFPRKLEKEITIAVLKLINCWEYQSCEHQYNAGSLPWVAMDRIKQLAYVKTGYESFAQREALFAGRTTPNYGSRIYDLAPWEYSRQEWKLFLTALREQALTSG